MLICSQVGAFKDWEFDIKCLMYFIHGLIVSEVENYDIAASIEACQRVDDPRKFVVYLQIIFI